MGSSTMLRLQIFSLVRFKEVPSSFKNLWENEIEREKRKTRVPGKVAKKIERSWMASFHKILWGKTRVATYRMLKFMVCAISIFTRGVKLLGGWESWRRCVLGPLTDWRICLSDLVAYSVFSLDSVVYYFSPY